MVARDKKTTIEFELGHGCGDSPTESLLMKADDTLRAKGVTNDTWVATEDDEADTLLLTARTPIPHDTPTTIHITVEPLTTGEIRLPVIQQCTTGSNEWIQSEVEGQPEPDFPAPVLVVKAEVTASESKESEEDGSPVGLVTMVVGGVIVVVAAGSLVARSRRRKNA